MAGVRILGLGKVDRLLCLGVGSLTELPLKQKPKNPNSKPCAGGDTRVFVDEYTIYMNLVGYIGILLVFFCVKKCWESPLPSHHPTSSNRHLHQGMPGVTTSGKAFVRPMNFCKDFLLEKTSGV